MELFEAHSFQTNANHMFYYRCVSCVISFGMRTKRFGLVVFSGWFMGFGAHAG